MFLDEALVEDGRGRQIDPQVGQAIKCKRHAHSCVCEHKGEVGLAAAAKMVASLRQIETVIEKKALLSPPSFEVILKYSMKAG